MQIQPISINNQTAFNGYRDLSKVILDSERKELINIAEFFHKSPEEELRQITKSNSSAYDRLKEAIDCVITRKKCYLADGASFARERAEQLDAKAETRNLYYKA